MDLSPFNPSIVFLRANFLGLIKHSIPTFSSLQSFQILNSVPPILTSTPSTFAFTVINYPISHRQRKYIQKRKTFNLNFTIKYQLKRFFHTPILHLINLLTHLPISSFLFFITLSLSWSSFQSVHSQMSVEKIIFH